MARPKGSTNKPHAATPEKDQLADGAIHSLPDPIIEPAPINPESHPVPAAGESRKDDAPTGSPHTPPKPKGKNEAYVQFLAEKEAENREFPNAATAYRVAREKFLEVFA